MAGESLSSPSGAPQISQQPFGPGHLPFFLHRGMKLCQPPALVGLCAPWVPMHGTAGVMGALPGHGAAGR